MHVVGNGVRVDELERAAQSRVDFRARFFGPGSHHVACLVGSIKPAKDYHLALDSAARLVRGSPQWRVLFIGDQLTSTKAYRPGADSDTASYKAQIVRHHARLGVPERIRFVGERGDALAIVKQCDVLFSTSCREGFPNVVLEAMAIGVPVASTDYSDIRPILPCAPQVAIERTPEAEARAGLRAHSDRRHLGGRQHRWRRRPGSTAQRPPEVERYHPPYGR